MAKVLVVEDDQAILDKIVEWFRFEKHIVDHANNGSDGLHLLLLGEYDAAIIDWNMPQLTGVEVVRQYRSRGGKTPVLFLTGRSETNDKIAGLDSGADDYITKPFDLRELSSRLRALLRRPAIRISGDLLKAGDLTIDPQLHEVTRAGEPVHLQPVEFAILECLMRNANSILTADQLMSKAWSSEGEVTPATLRTYIRDLRRKLDRSGEESVIVNVHGKGYMIKSSEA